VLSLILGEALAKKIMALRVFFDVLIFERYYVKRNLTKIVLFPEKHICPKIMKKKHLTFYGSSSESQHPLY
jgi:hypothetical protein